MGSDNAVSYAKIGAKLDRKAEREAKRRHRRSERRNAATVAWARQIKERDGQCVECGSAERLQAHHIQTRKVRPDLALDLNNGKTLCKSCHRLEHPELPDVLFA